MLCWPLAPAAVEKYRLNIIAEGLDYPWSIDFLPDGRRIVSELGGKLRIIGINGGLGPPLAGVPDVYRSSQGGMFDVLLHPRFAENRLVYLSYAAGDVQSNATTVARAKLSDTALTDVEVVFAVRPSKYAPIHFGGRLAWLNDGTLLLTTGDGFDFREAAQDRNSQLGKILRMNADGSPAPDNPFPDTPYVWSYGHRNPQGLVVTSDGTVYAHEHGPKGGDEINLIKRGSNYGWPVITYGMDYSGALVSPFTSYAGMEQPLHTWVPSIAPCGMMMYAGDLFPQWHGSLFIGALINKEVRRVKLSNGEVTEEEALFAELDARIRDVRAAPDGSIYILTDGEAGKVIQVEPMGSDSIVRAGK